MYGLGLGRKSVPARPERTSGVLAAQGTKLHTGTAQTLEILPGARRSSLVAISPEPILSHFEFFSFFQKHLAARKAQQGQ